MDFKDLRISGLRSVRAMFLVLGILVSPQLVAGDYKLISGQGKSVCDAYRRNLEPRHDIEPMACERRYDPAIRGFSTPPWHKLELAGNFELFRNVWLYMQESNGSPTGMKLSDKEVEQDAASSLEQMSKSMHIELYVASLDLIGNGRLHNVLALVQDGCGPHPHKYPDGRITRPFVLDSNGKDVAREVPEIWNSYSNATIEMFNGQVYLESYLADDNWQKLLKGSGSLTVSRFTPDGIEGVCEVTWTPNSTDAQRGGRQ